MLQVIAAAALLLLGLGAALAVVPVGAPMRIAIALAGVVTLAGAVAPRRSEDVATTRDEVLALVFALVTPLAWLARGGVPPALLVFPALALEAWGPATARTLAAARGRASAFALVGALTLVRGAERDPLGPVAEDVLFIFATAAAAVAVERRPLGLARRGAGLLLLLATCAWGLCHLPFEAARARGLAPGVVFVGSLAALAFFLAAKALARASRPGPFASTLATLLAAGLAAEAGMRLKENLAGRSDTLDAVRTFAQPLVAFGGSNLVALGQGRRGDCRGLEFEPKKPAGTYRVVLLGGSSSYGLFQDDRAKSPAGRIEAHLRAARPGLPLEVICLAFPAVASDQELGWIAGHAVDWEVDLVIALDDYNDMSYLARAAALPGGMFGWEQHQFGFSVPFARFVLKYSVLLRPAAAKRAIRPGPGKPSDLLPGAANGFWLDGLVANEEAMAILARDAGARFVWASVPIVLDRKVLGPGEDAALAKSGEPLLRTGPTADEVRRRNALLRDRVARAVTAQGGTVIDLPARIARRSVLAANEAWFGDECHYTDRGVDVIAEELVDAMLEAGVVRG